MFSRKETSELRKEFWTAFGQYMAPVLSTDGERINWINYKTGIKGIQFKMNAEGKTAEISIHINHPDLTHHELIFEKFQELKNILNETLEEEWTWPLHSGTEQGKKISKIYTEREGVNVMRKEDWPALISFFKPRMIALDKFWSVGKYAFEELA
jgi:hypothetical protein